MKIYFAGAPGLEKRERIWQRKIKQRLLSYYNIQEKEFSVPYAFNLIKQTNRNHV